MNEPIYKAVIPMNPITKKNSQRILFNNRTHRPFIAQSAAYSQYEKDCGYFLRRPTQGTINERIEITCYFFRKNFIRCDLTNLLAAIDDILVHYKIIADDNVNIIVSHDGSRCFVDKDNPRTEIYIYRYSEV